jgi:hypothetical protein
MAPRRCDPEEVIALNAQGFGQKQIAARVGITQGSVCELLRRHGVKSFRQPGGVRKYFINEEYFASVETPEQAYWLGFLAADGFVIGRTVLGLNLAVRDVAHVELFRSVMGADEMPLLYVPPPKKGPIKGGTGTYGLRLNSLRLVQDVARYGIGPRKSQHCIPWDAPADLLPHYWRGLIDGDGHVSSHKYGYLSFCGTKEMCDGFIGFANSVCGTEARPIQTGKIWKLSINGKRQVHALLTAMYANDEVALARKKAVAMAYIAEPYKARTSPPCRICGKPAVAQELCGKHYQRWQKHGDPLAYHLGHGPDGRFISAADQVAI